MGTLRPRPTGEHGFTLVEVLVVVLIAAVLIAIALPLFINQRTKAQDGEAKSTVAAVAQAFEIWHQERGTYAGAGRAELARIEPTIAQARGLVVDGTADGYAISVASTAAAHGGGPFALEKGADGTERTCAAAGRGGCPDGGRW
jgi:type IV pilus assembly protein PilA